jgi:hypothetical protein
MFTMAMERALQVVTNTMKDTCPPSTDDMSVPLLSLSPATPMLGALDPVDDGGASNNGPTQTTSGKPTSVPPWRRRSQRCHKSSIISNDDVILVPSRHGDITLKGRAATVYQGFEPQRYDVPKVIPINEEFLLWGRRWIVKASSLGEHVGLGIFACEDIIVPSACHPDAYVPLFPYCGAMYTWGHWGILTKAASSFKVYSLSVDSHPDSKVPLGQRRFIDGDPIRSSNLAGYMNSTMGTKPKRRVNVEWVLNDGPAILGTSTTYVDMHIMTVATTTIHAGQELLAHYDWSTSHT